MISIIENNPFRILGAYSDTSLKDIIANAGRIKAFAKVNREVTFDIDSIISCNENPSRTIETVDNSLSKIQSETDRVKFSLFWFNNSNVDFGTKYLVSGDYKSAVSTFVKTIESITFTKIQAVLGDKSDRLSSIELLKIYTSVLLEEDISEDIISSCISCSSINEHILYLCTLKSDKIANKIKNLAESVIQLKVGDSIQIFNSLNSKIVASKKMMDSLSGESSLLIDGAYDQFCKSIRLKVVSISNNAFDNIGKLEKDFFIEILKKCLSVLKTVNLSHASAGTKDKYQKDVETISENIKDADDTYLMAIATNEEICWFCGDRATGSYEKKYEKKDEFWIDYNMKRVITYTKSAKFHVCKKCMLYDKLELLFFPLGIMLVVVVEYLVVRLFTEDWKDSFVIILLSQIIVGGATLYGGIVLGKYIFQTIWNKFHLRAESDHPLVKLIKKEGYR